MGAERRSTARGPAGQRNAWVLSVGLLVVLGTGVARAQEAGRDQPLLQEVASRVAIDPTTYAPTMVVYTARQLDWSSSQRVFDLGYVEAIHATRRPDCPMPHR